MILNSETATTLKYRAVYQLASVICNFNKVFSAVSYIAGTEAQKDNCSIKTPNTDKVNWKKCKRSDEIFSFGRRDLSHKQFTQRDQA